MIGGTVVKETRVSLTRSGLKNEFYCHSERSEESRFDN